MEDVFYNSHDYDDIIDLPHHVSPARPHMPKIDRAAQFAPFSALSGFGAAIRETGRQTEARRELSEDARDALDEKLQMIRRAGHPEVVITYFRPDDKKDGGCYSTVSGCIVKIDAYDRVFVMEDGTKIPIGDIVELGIKE